MPDECGSDDFAASLAATSLNQARGSEAERVQHDTAAKERQIEGDRKAENAAGIGTAEEDEAAGDRDADGHRLWKSRLPAKERPTKMPPKRPCVRNPSGQSGSLLDLTG